jgi:predicted alpha/beta-fold hydrolase
MVILPGLNSCNQDEYIHTLIKAGLENGYDWTLINYRGMTHGLTTPIPFSTSDFESFN